MNVTLQYSWKTLAATLTIAFNSIVVLETGHLYSHSKTFKENMKTLNTESLIEFLAKSYKKFSESATDSVGMTDRVLESIRLLSPVSHEGMKWDNSNYLKIKMQEEISKTSAS
jgi:hypothetical protein